MLEAGVARSVTHQHVHCAAWPGFMKLLLVTNGGLRICHMLSCYVRAGDLHAMHPAMAELSVHAAKQKAKVCVRMHTSISQKFVWGMLMLLAMQSSHE